jgi:hypothetical protein
MSINFILSLNVLEQEFDIVDGLVLHAENADSLGLQRNKVLAILGQSGSSSVVCGAPVDLGFPQQIDWLVRSQALLFKAHKGLGGVVALSKLENSIEEVDVFDLSDVGGTIGWVRKVLDSHNDLVGTLGKHLELHLLSETSVFEQALEALLNRLEVSGLLQIGTIKAVELLKRAVNSLLEESLDTAVNKLWEEADVHTVGSRDGDTITVNISLVNIFINSA